MTVLSQSEQGAIRFQSTGSIGDWQAIPQPPSHNHQSLVGVVHQGIVYIFAIDSEMRLMYCVFTPGTGWSAWTVQQDGRLKGNIAAASCNNALYVFGRGTEDKLHIRTLVNGQWTPWMDTFPGPSNNRLASSPAVIGSHDTMELFARAHDGHIWSAGFQRGAWSHWTEVPGQGVAKDGLAVARASDGTLHLAVVGLDDAVYVQRRNPQTLQWAPAWSSVGGITHHPISAACHGTDLHIVCTGTDNTVYHQIAGKTHWAQMPRSNNSRFGPGIFVL